MPEPTDLPPVLMPDGAYLAAALTEAIGEGRGVHTACGCCDCLAPLIDSDAVLDPYPGDCDDDVNDGEDLRPEPDGAA